jgi:hypothetical protein
VGSAQPPYPFPWRKIIRLLLAGVLITAVAVAAIVIALRRRAGPPL